MHEWCNSITFRSRDLQQLITATSEENIYSIDCRCFITKHRRAQIAWKAYTPAYPAGTVKFAFEESSSHYTATDTSFIYSVIDFVTQFKQNKYTHFHNQPIINWFG